MKRLDASQKSVEGEEVLKLLTNKQLQFLSELSEQGYRELIEIFDLLAMRAKETVYVYSKPAKSVDELIEVNAKQNLHSGRITMLLLLDYLISHAGKKMETNMEGKES